MARKTKHTEDQRIRAVEEYMKGEGGYVSIAKKYKISKTALQDYVRRGKAEGIDKLRISGKNGNSRVLYSERQGLRSDS